MVFALHYAVDSNSPSSKTNCLIFTCRIIVAFLWFCHYKNIAKEWAKDKINGCKKLQHLTI